MALKTRPRSGLALPLLLAFAMAVPASPTRADNPPAHDHCRTRGKPYKARTSPPWDLRG